MMPSFEFTKKHNRIFIALTQTMLQTTIIEGVIGVILIALAIAELFVRDESTSLGDIYRVAGFFVGPLVLIMAYYSYQPLANFRNIIETEGKDIEDLMIALDGLSQLFNAARIILTIIAVAMIIWLLLSF